jgi:conjugative relaxase-like TrwC/TraI family protein
VLSIAKLAAGQQHYYVSAVAKGVEDYYTGRGEAPGEWLSTGGSSELALSGRVDEDDLHAVLSGADPRDGAQMIRSSRRVPGFDATFSAPKSVSLLYALGDPETAKHAVEAHDAAVLAAVGHLERVAAYGRRGAGGAEQIATSGLVAAAFRHRTSRTGDPQLHTHVLIANMARGIDARWSALDGRLLLLNGRTAGYLYQAHLRAELTRRLGVTWKQPVKGMAELEGIPTAVLRAFSQRRVEIEARMEEMGVRGRDGAQVATLDTRRDKRAPEETKTLRERWAAEAAVLGFTRRDVAKVRGKTREPAPTTATRQRLDQVLTEHASFFDRRDVLRAIAEAASEGVDVREAELRADRYVGSSAVAPLSPAVTGMRYSTPELLAIEQALLESAERHAYDGVGIATNDDLRQAIAERPSLNDEQREFVQRITTSGAAIELVVGAAGAGKTFALDAARAAWQRSGHRVIGVALAARAAAELQAGSGIPSFTIDALLYHCESNRHSALPANSIVVVDEAGMVGTRKLDRLHRLTRRANAKLVLVGDPRQLPEIQAGGAFVALFRRIGGSRLLANMRQRDPIERLALRELRGRKVNAAIERLTEHGRVHELPTADTARTELVTEWHNARTSGAHAVMVALRRVDVADLNARARSILKSTGEVKGQELLTPTGAFAVGDEVLATRNRRRRGLINGTIGTVTAVNRRDFTISIRTRDGHDVVVPTDYIQDGHLTHAYAISIHKAQGMTCDASFVLGDDQLYLEAGYTALSRGRHRNELFTVQVNEAEHDCSDAHETRAPDIVAALTRTRAQQLGTDLQASQSIGVDR